MVLWHLRELKGASNPNAVLCPAEVQDRSHGQDEWQSACCPNPNSGKSPIIFVSSSRIKLKDNSTKGIKEPIELDPLPQVFVEVMDAKPEGSEVFTRIKTRIPGNHRKLNSVNQDGASASSGILPSYGGSFDDIPELVKYGNLPLNPTLRSSSPLRRPFCVGTPYRLRRCLWIPHKLLTINRRRYEHRSSWSLCSLYKEFTQASLRSWTRSQNKNKKSLRSVSLSRHAIRLLSPPGTRQPALPSVSRHGTRLRCLSPPALGSAVYLSAQSLSAVYRPALGSAVLSLSPLSTARHSAPLSG
ncbi:hypothetical protein FCM35_KLT11997 [Carex littledalei]|uniref:Uncharacterized protein n=1 Tax=Carex littledalei TaxID=544730 RepID=A0A833QJD2_9POAL|nr:hypothetical protein FCM35_KLT11997 [Carex littledalei]